MQLTYKLVWCNIKTQKGGNVMQNIILQKKIDELKTKLEALMIDENASPIEILKASQDLDVLISEFYKKDNIPVTS